MKNDVEFYEVDYDVIFALEAEKMEHAPKFEEGKSYNVDGQSGQFVRQFIADGRPTYVFSVDGKEVTLDFDFIYLVD